MDGFDKQLIVPSLNLSNLYLNSQQLNDHIEIICNNLINEANDLSIVNYSKSECGEKESITRQEQEDERLKESFNDIHVTKLNISHNHIGSHLPRIITHSLRNHLKSLDLSDNYIVNLDFSIVRLTALTELNLSGNRLTHKSFPPGFDRSFNDTLKVLILSGNRLGMIPCQVFKLKRLESLHLGGNQLECLPKEISSLNRLKVLYLGGNKLKCIANNIGQLSRLEALALCDNQLEYLPASISKLRNLRSLALHNNNLTTLPQDIIKLNRLIELSLRNNPLVVRFVQDIAKTRVLPLLELCARSIKTNNIQYNTANNTASNHNSNSHHYHSANQAHSSNEAGSSSSITKPQQQINIRLGCSNLPTVLVEYLNSACRCVNPKCKGVYFESKVEHVKFVDFCGSYRLPLLQYLCSQECTEYRTSDEEEGDEDDDDGDDADDGDDDEERH